MTQSIEEFSAQWRASAHEAVPYTDDFPECFLVLPELIDGAIGQGSATKIIIEIKFIDDNNGYLKVTDNGVGVKNPSRLLSWASKESTSIHHRYGHGSKKCLTKWNKDYNSKWYIKYRYFRTRGVDALFQYNSPFKGINTECKQDDENEIDLMPSGLEWYIEFTRDILNNKNTLTDTFDSIKEIIRTRYNRYHLDKTEFIIKVFDDNTIFEESSKLNNWTCFEEEVKKEVDNNNCINIYNDDIEFNENTKITYKVYFLKINGGKGFDLKKEFQTYGHKNMNCSRIYISLNQRIIEVAPFWKFIKDRESNHNSLNGIIAFINFENVDKTNQNIYVDNLPTPCTTKVSFYENCKNFIKIKNILFELNPQIIKNMNTKPQPQPQPLPPPKPITPVPSDSSDSSEDTQTGSDVEEPEPKPKPKPKPKPRPNPSVPRNIKELIWNKYIGEDIIKHRCCCCKIRIIKNTNFHAGHIIAKSKGGKNTVDNLRPICQDCNLGMGATNMIDYIKQHEFYINN